MLCRIGILSPISPMFCRFGISSEKKFLIYKVAIILIAKKYRNFWGVGVILDGGELDGVRPVMSIIGHRKGI